MDVLQHLIIGRMDVPANGTLTVAGFGQRDNGILKLGDEIDRRFHLCLNLFRDRVIFLAAEGAPFVVDPIKAKQPVVADGTEVGDEAQVAGDAIEDIAVEDQVFAFPGVVDVFLNDLDSLKFKWQETP